MNFADNHKAKTTSNLGGCFNIVIILIIFIILQVIWLKIKPPQSNYLLLNKLKVENKNINSISDLNTKSYMQGCSGMVGFPCFKTKEYIYKGFFTINGLDLYFPFDIVRNSANISDWAINPKSEYNRIGIVNYEETNVFRNSLYGERWRKFIEFVNNENSIKGSKIERISNFTAYAWDSDPTNIRDMNIYQYKYDDVIIFKNLDDKILILVFDDKLDKWNILQKDYQKLIKFYNTERTKQNINNIDFNKVK